jgi:hypothetical protein
MHRLLSLSLVLLALGCSSDATPTTTPLAPGSPMRSGGSSAIQVSAASLVGTTLAVQGSSAKGGATITVNGIRLGTASSSGSFSVSSSSFTSTACVITVSDGRTSANPTLDPCSPSASGGGSGRNVPTPLAPAAGSSVLQPVTLSWSTPTTATPVVGYNWEVSTNSGFTTVVFANSVNAPATQDVLSGLPNGQYYWRVQAVEQGSPSSGLVVDPWSVGVSFTITGSAAGAPSTPTITFPASGAQYHPYEMFYPRWTASTNADSYYIEYSSDSVFTPVNNQFNRTLDAAHSRDSITFGEPLATWIRVRGLSASGVRGVPSKAIRVIVTYSAPIGPPPSLLSPAVGARGQLPMTFTWTDVQNPQPEGYTLQISRDSKFTGDCAPPIEYCNMLITGTSYTVVASNQSFSLPSGTHYWRVRSIQGSSSPTLPALTAWSQVRSFIVP